MEIMTKFGINTDKLKHTAPPEVHVLPTVKGRTVHIDADFLAYQVSHDDEKTFAEMQHNCDISVEKMRLMSGSQHVALHLTPKGSDKGGRYDIALLKEYQGNRKDKKKPKFLHVMREWMHKERGAVLHMHCEADDGMATAQYAAIADGKAGLSVIATKDKDLCMVPGLQLNWDTGELTNTDNDYGYTMLVVSDNKSKTKKIKGRGWKYFWAQMLTGDTADNIQGLPKVCDPAWCPTGKYKAVGPVLANDILAPIFTNQEAFCVVRDLYKQYGEKVGFVNYRDGTHVRWQDAFLSEAKLLWMRREEDENDVLKWMEKHCL